MPKGSSNKSREVAQLLQWAILQGHLRPGARLPAEIKIARALSVSQASVREALLELESRGLIVGYHNRGSYVIELTTDDLMNIHQVRRELEPLACALAAYRLSRETADALQECLDRMRAAGQRRDFLDYSTADLEFHRQIWKAQPNRPLEKMLTLLCLPLFAYDLVMRYSSPNVNFDRVIKQHELLLAALRTREPERVRRLTTRLVERWTRQDIADFEKIPAGAKSGDANGDAADFLRLLSEEQSRRAGSNRDIDKTTILDQKA